MGGMTRLEAMAARVSTRSFDGRPLEEGQMEALKASLALRQAEPTLSGRRVRLSLACVDLGDAPLKMGTYGLVSGVSAFIVPAVERGEGAMVDLGWALEAAVLDATALGISSCWIGGLFSRSAAAGFVRANDDEIVPALIALGYAAARRSLQDRIVTGMAKSRSRRPLEELAQVLEEWADDPAAAQAKQQSVAPSPELYDEPLRRCLEAVRIAPSASNKQPWRFIIFPKEKGTASSIGLYLNEDKLYNNALGEAKMQHIDIGIAMRHFADAAVETGFPGSWKLTQDLPPNIKASRARWIPIALWGL